MSLLDEKRSSLMKRLNLKSSYIDPGEQVSLTLVLRRSEAEKFIEAVCLRDGVVMWDEQIRRFIKAFNEGQLRDDSVEKYKLHKTSSTV